MKGLFVKKKTAEHPEQNEEEISRLLKAMPIFTDLTRRELAAVARILHEREYQPEEVIFRENEPGMGMYILQTGRVAILSEAGNLQLAEFGDGSFFGEVALLDAAPRSATAVAKDKCRIFGFFQPDLYSLIERNPALGIKIVLGLSRLVCDRLRQTNQRTYAINAALQQMRQTPQ
ncbi:MAG TPA: cyclic nucleotide-binding domain-containing protein [bacterium]|nr:cyclic nucleotide-binding domain-containing protein [bacterium]HPR88252.1 cyclic nucleotide-binding domain-containing protein [bacterium]